MRAAGIKARFRDYETPFVTEYADGLMMLDGKKSMAQAEQLYAQASELKPADAMERLDLEAALEQIE